MKKLFTRGLVAVAALAIPAGAVVAMTGTASAATGPQKAPVYNVTWMTENTVSGPAAGVTATANSFAVNTLDPTTGDLTTTVHLQGLAPNTTYYANVYADGQVQPYSMSIPTNGQGNGTANVVNNDPAASHVTVEIYYFDSTGMHNLQSSLVSVS